jgi:hypothetical protein
MQSFKGTLWNVPIQVPVASLHKEKLLMSQHLHRPLYYLGADLGNRTSIGFVRDAENLNERHAQFSSFLADIAAQEYERFRIGTQSSLSVHEGEYVLSYEGKHCFVGSLAQQQGPLATDAKGVGDRYWTRHNMLLLLNLIALLLSPAELRRAGGYNPEDDTYECSVRVGTGMPVSVYTPARADLIRSAFNGIHRFTFNGSHYIVTIDIGPVIMEGVGGLLLHGGTGRNKKAVIDCGYWSTEILRKENGQFIRDSSAGEAIGIGMAFDALKSTVALEFGRELSEDEAQRLLLAQARKEALPPVLLYGKPLNSERLARVTEEALAVPGVPLQKMVASKLGSARGLVATDIDPVVFVGGSAYYLQSFVAAKVPHVTVPREPEFANARAYCLLAGAYRDWHETPYALTGTP